MVITFIRTLIVYITLIIVPISLIPQIGLLLSFFVSIWLGFNGNRLALKNKEFESLEKFLQYQKKWSIAGIIFFLILPIIFFMELLGNYNKAINYQKKIEKINSTTVKLK